MSKFILALAIVILSISAFSAPGFPETISYQGQLLDNSGNIVSDGNFLVVFTFFLDIKK